MVGRRLVCTLVGEEKEGVEVRPVRVRIIFDQIGDGPGNSKVKVMYTCSSCALGNGMPVWRTGARRGRGRCNNVPSTLYLCGGQAR